MSKGNIIIVVNKVNKKVIESVTEKVKPYLSEVGDAIQFSFEDLEVDLTKNENLSGLQEALDELGEDDYAYCVTVEKLETLDIYGSPKKFGLTRVMAIPSYKTTIH
tara:strand:- start:9302 stop:9619 length:318 start_codon:yes stop_codon:yes gene_type:complete